MAAVFSFSEDNGTQTGSPLKGATRTTSRTENNWKDIDDSTTAYTANPIVAGNNSYTKYQFGVFTGSFNEILNGKWAHTSGTLGSNLTLKGTVTSTYATPSTTTNAALTTNMTTAIAIGSGLTVQFSETGPEDGSPTSNLTAPGYTQYLATQLQTASGAAAGDTATVVLTLSYDEN